VALMNFNHRVYYTSKDLEKDSDPTFPEMRRDKDSQLQKSISLCTINNIFLLNNIVVVEKITKIKTIISASL